MKKHIWLTIGIILSTLLLCAGLLIVYLQKTNSLSIEKTIKFCENKGGIVYVVPSSSSLLSNLIPSNLYPFKKIEYISFEGVRVSKKDIEDLYLLYPELERIYFNSVSQMTDEKVKALIKFKKIERLSLCGNPITDVALMHLSSLTQLTDLDIKGTSVNGHGFSAFKENSSLIFLTISNTKIDNIGIEIISRKFPHLKCIGAGATQINDNGVMHLQELPLETISLYDTNVSDKGVMNLPKFKLERLGLEQTQITGECLKSICSAKKLKKLGLDNTKVDSDSLLYLENMNNLQVLSLRDTKINDKAIAYLAKLSLCELFLDNTSISNLSIKQLSKFKTLKLLSIKGTLITLQEARKLRKAIPDCQINY